jgi:hypothetical protein
MPVNKVLVDGRLGGDPEPGTTKNGKPFVKFSFAYQKSPFPPTWITCFAYGKSVEIIEKLKISKGDLVMVDGSLQALPKIGDCNFIHLCVRAEYVYLQVKARTSEDKHFKDVEQPKFGEEEPPFA